ncbi:hypothetical protein Cgig2_020737 [Carnegiea gigantea]|uniref:Cytochrome P450 n=1 Tax=Carnegiea gigantea TaxID=171969 RepID=A0A9Q1GLU1_9CARY|nr:hypothetical protein Cgig2_020737 [Carnegiea gigantea]
MSCFKKVVIAKSKAPWELLNWEDIQKMKHSWNVANMRLVPPLQGAFRQAITDFICSLGGFDGVNSAITFTAKYLAEFPHIYDLVYRGVFREALHEFMYAGFTIPKGWKLQWSAYTTHLNPEYFPNPEKFDPTRFEGKGPDPYTYVAFGGGTRLCPGRDYARLTILVYMHNMVKRFRWEKLLPNEQITVDLSPHPAEGLPIRLIPHEKNNTQN